MAAYAEKKFIDATKSVDSTTRRLDVEYYIYDATDDADAEAALWRDSLTGESGLVRTGISGLRRIANTTWECTVNYAPWVGGLPDPSLIEFPGQESSFQFETGGGRRTIRKNLYTVDVKVPNGTAAPNVGDKAFKLINATPENGVEGVEIEQSVFSFSITKTYATGELPSSYVQTVYDLTDCVNSIPVTISGGGITLTFQAGELLFKGGSGSIADSDGRWRYSYNFAASRNEVINDIDGFDPFTKGGWEYVEIKTAADVVTSGDLKIPVRKPIAVIIHGVYPKDDLNALGI